MKRTILVFGLIAGAIASAFMGVSMLVVGNHCTGDSKTMEYSMYVGYASMIVAFSFIFVAIKSYRDKQNGGSITYWNGLKIGLMIALIGSTMYVITWAFIYNFAMPDFMTNYASAAIEGARTSGKSPQEIADVTKEMNDMVEMYKSPIGFTLMTYMEIIPVGILMALAAAGILRRKPKDGLTVTA